MAAKKLPDVQLRLAGGLRAALAQAYALQEVPTYILIGEDETFFNFKPKRLSSHAAVDEINQSFDEAAPYLNTPELAAIKR